MLSFNRGPGGCIINYSLNGCHDVKICICIKSIIICSFFSSFFLFVGLRLVLARVAAICFEMLGRASHLAN